MIFVTTVTATNEEHNHWRLHVRAFLICFSSCYYRPSETAQKIQWPHRVKSLPLRRGFGRGNTDFVSWSHQVGDVWSLDDTSYKDLRTRAPRVSGSYIKRQEREAGFMLPVDLLPHPPHPPLTLWSDFSAICDVLLGFHLFLSTALSMVS